MGTVTQAETVADAALDQALERIGELSNRLWAVQHAHRPRATRGWHRASQCHECGQAFPCPTSRLVSGRH